MALTPEQFFGKIGVKNGVFTEEQLEECFRVQRDIFLETGEREALSYILMRKGYMTHEESRDLLQEFKYSCMRKDDKEIAEIAQEKSYLTPEQVKAALAFQRKLFRGGVGIFQLGEILISRGFLTPDQVYELHCVQWRRRHPGKPLPEVHDPEVPDEKVDTKTKVIKVSKKEVEVIKKQGKFRTCPACSYKNPAVAEICYHCGEPLPRDNDDKAPMDTREPARERQRKAT